MTHSFCSKIDFRSLLIYLSIFSSINRCASERLPGQIMAFIDINADCFTDLVVNTSSNSIAVYVASEKDPTFQEDTRFKKQFADNSRILNIGVGDFDGDSYPDLAVSLTLTQKENPLCSNGHRVEICYGRTNKFDCQPLLFKTAANPNATSAIFCEHPLIFDCDVDQRNDLLTTIFANGNLEFACFRATNDTVFELISPFPSKETLEPASSSSSLTSHAFVDLSGDLNPEIVLWTKLSDSEKYLANLTVLKLSEGKNWILAPHLMSSPPVPVDKPLLSDSSKSKSKNKNRWLIGQSVYDDFNKDGKVDHLLPFCEPNADGECDRIHFSIWIADKWYHSDAPLANGVGEKAEQWLIYQESWGTGQSDDIRTFHIRSGDYTQDGYPDLLVVLKQKAVDPKSGQAKRAAFLLENVGCAAGAFDCKRTFQIKWNSFGAVGGQDEFANSVITATFFDLSEDGTLDVLLEYRNRSSEPQVVMDFSASAFEGDTTFLKVQVFTATCLDECRFGREGSAISLPGAALIYTSSDAEGNPILGSYTQRSVSSYRPLLLPYALFGLGRTPNFVEKLQIGVPSWPPKIASWQQLVPNSRIYVIPYPLDQPWKWVHRLYLTPNRLIIYSFVSLSSVCALIIIVVFGLHMQERRMDKKERELQRERFHFDAM